MSRLGSLDPAPPLDPIRYLDSSASRCNVVHGVTRVSPHLRVCRELSENRTLVSRRGGVHSLKRRLTRNGFNILSCEFCEQHIVETSPLSPSLSPPLLSPTHFLWPPLLQHPGGPFPPTVQPFPRRRLKFNPPPSLRGSRLLSPTASNKRCRRPVCFYRAGGGGGLFARHAFNAAARCLKLQIS